ncbi:MAG: DUF4112 domain-containing protein [Flavobacteriales bacterium]
MKTKNLKNSTSTRAESEADREELKYLQWYAKLLDSQFRIPGTDISFGIDPLLGLIPGLGDLIGYGFSAVLLYSAFRKGVKGEVLIKMLGNIGLDALVGMVPVLGTVFDFVYKANTRNYQLLTEFVEEDKHTRSAWPFILGFLGVTILVVCAVIYGVFTFLGWLFSAVGSWF